MKMLALLVLVINFVASYSPWKKSHRAAGRIPNWVLLGNKLIIIWWRVVFQFCFSLSFSHLIFRSFVVADTLSLARSLSLSSDR